jgi:hypothetical protein
VGIFYNNQTIFFLALGIEFVPHNMALQLTACMPAQSERSRWMIGMGAWRGAATELIVVRTKDKAGQSVAQAAKRDES